MREDGKPREDGKLREDGKPRKCWGDVSRERSNGVTCLTWLQFHTSRLKKTNTCVLHKRYLEHVDIATGKLFAESTPRDSPYGRRVRNKSAGHTAKGKVPVVLLYHKKKRAGFLKLSFSRRVPLGGARRPRGKAHRPS
jgi:hypothetical protein